MDTHLVSATLSPEDQQAIHAAIETLRQKLPFLIDLTIATRRALPKLGDKSQAFVQKAVEIANEHEQMFSPAFMDEMRKDAHLLEVLSPIHLAIRTLAKKIDDTTMQVGAEAYAEARTIYIVTKTPFARAILRTASDDLSKRYPRRKKPDPAAPGAPAPGAPAPVVPTPVPVVPSTPPRS